MAILIEVEPCHARPEGTELLHQQRLARIITEHLLLVSVIEHSADIVEQWRLGVPGFQNRV